MKHLLSLESLSADQIAEILRLAARLKKERQAGQPHTPVLKGQCWGMIFTKASTRTRVSFEVGVRELGGWVTYLSPRDTQLGRGEPIKDTARVMGRMMSGAIIRTFSQEDVVDFAQYSGIPTINALTDAEHPCQVLADLQTMEELCRGYVGKKVVFLGDGDNNMSRSWMWAAERLGFEFVIAAPSKYQPSAEYLKQFNPNNVRCEADPVKAVQDADVLYTDVWVSMGQEDDAQQRIADLKDYQINHHLIAQAKPGAIVLHCLPAYREKEITHDALEAHASSIFQQAENRLHAQKAVLMLLNASR